MDQEKAFHGGIVCATRGGAGSEPTVQYAIEQAKACSLPLVFCYIADLEFMKYTEIGRTELIAEEVRKMGEFIMLTLVERARAAGVEAGLAVREGEFLEELLPFLEEIEAKVLVLGCPKPEASDACYFEADKLTELAQEITAKTGIQVDVV